jgi:uncharacterized phage protein gp47/JayE
MSGTLSPTAAYVDQYGIHAPTFTDIQNYLILQFQRIYGSDIVTSNDSQDGQLIGVLALALADTNSACLAVYNSFSPSTAQGVGLSSMVKINGMTRQLPSNSMVDLVLVGQAGTPISNGYATDVASQRWNLPVSVLIPPSGTITVTATAAQPGALTAQPGDITRIGSPTRGWQSVNNPTAANPGAPVETDAALRVRQSTSAGLPSASVLAGILGAVLSLPGVTGGKIYENDTGATDATTGLSAHSIGLVIEGGDAALICQTILHHKTPGCYTEGTTRVSTDDVYGLPHDIGFYVPTQKPVGVAITLTAKPGYSSVIGLAISQTIADYINGQGSGEEVVYSKLWSPANLCDTTTGQPPSASNTYDITAMTMGTPVDGTGASYSTANIPVAIFEIAMCDPANVVITVS